MSRKLVGGILVLLVALSVPAQVRRVTNPGAGFNKTVRSVVPVIKVIMPKAGANLIKGQGTAVAWTYAGIPDDALVKVDLYRNGAMLAPIALNEPIRYPPSPAGTGLYNWVAGDYFGGKAELGCHYSIRVQTVSGTIVSGESGAFCLTDPGLAPTLLLLAPRGGQEWNFGTEQKIEWSCTHYSGPLRIALFKGNSPWGVIARPDAVAGSYSWKVGEMPPPDDTRTWVTASDYRIVIDNGTSLLQDNSAKPFTITCKSKIPGLRKRDDTPRWLKVTSPEAGSVWLRGQTYSIGWKQSDSLAKEFAHIVLLKGGVQVLDIVNHRPLQPGAHPWDVPTAGKLASGGDYQIQIQSTKYPEAVSVSPMFRIEAGSHEVTRTFAGRMDNVYRVNAAEGHSGWIKYYTVPDYGPDTIRVGFRNVNNDQCILNFRFRSRILFDLKGLKGTVKNVTVAYDKFDSTPTAATELYVFDSPWNGQALGMWEFNGTKLNPSDNAQMCGVVQKWIDNPAANYGLMIYMPLEVEKGYSSPNYGLIRNSNMHIQYFNNVRLTLVAEVVD